MWYHSMKRFVITSLYVLIRVVVPQVLMVWSTILSSPMIDQGLSCTTPASNTNQSKVLGLRMALSGELAFFDGDGGGVKTGGQISRHPSLVNAIADHVSMSRYMIMKLFLDKGVVNGKQVLYERLMSFLNNRPVMSTVENETTDW